MCSTKKAVDQRNVRLENRNNLVVKFLQKKENYNVVFTSLCKLYIYILEIFENKSIKLRIKNNFSSKKDFSAFCLTNYESILPL